MIQRTLKVVLCLCIVAASANSVASDKVTLDYSGSGVVVDYSGLIDSGENIVGVSLYQCDGAIFSTENGPDCLKRSVQDIVLTDDNRFLIADFGLFGFEVYASEDDLVGSEIKQVKIWQQFVVNLYQPPSTLIAAIEKHAPRYSFHTDEKYFPVPVSYLYQRPISDFFIQSTVLNSDDQARLFNQGSTITAAEYMQGNGEATSHIELSSTLAKLTNAQDPNNFPVYWLADEINGNKVRVHYISLYSFDEKNYSVNGFVGSFGDHSIDRESVAITFENSGGAWQPVDVAYAGHLAQQPIWFRGCVNDSTCRTAQAGDAIIADWNNGGTVVGWDSVSRVEDRPIVYVAHGSHAQFPARGHYDVLDEVANLGQQTVVLAEPAGTLQSTQEDFKSPNLVQIDFSRQDHAALTFSGTVIKGFSTKVRQFPFVRYPTQQWHASLGRTFEACVNDDSRTCREYIRRPNQCYGIGRRTSAVSSVAIDTDKDGVEDNRDAFPNNPDESSDVNLDGLGDNANPPIESAGIVGVVKNQRGTPIAGATVRLDYLQSNPRQPVSVQSITNSEGRYQLFADINSLPDTFAFSVISEEYLANPVLMRKSSFAASDRSWDFELEDCQSNIVQINKFPTLHHVGDDNFEGQTNSQIQREAEGGIISFGFKSPDSFQQYATFEISFFVKGVNSNDSYFSFDVGNRILLGPSEDDGGFFQVSFEGKISEYLVEGLNTLNFNAGINQFTGDLDDYEFINPVIRFF